MDPRLKHDLNSQKVESNPCDIYEKMRRENPKFIQPALDGVTMIWFIIRFEDVNDILGDDKPFVRDMGNAMTPVEEAALPQQPDIAEMINNHMLKRDGKDNERLRRSVWIR